MRFHGQMERQQVGCLPPGFPTKPAIPPAGTAHKHPCLSGSLWLPVCLPLTHTAREGELPGRALLVYNASRQHTSTKLRLCAVTE